MTKSELERRLEAAEKQNLGLMDEIKHLKEQLAGMQDEPEIPDFPKFERYGEFWYVRDNLNDVELGRAVCTIAGIAGDYNIFHTKEMAQEFANKCKLIAMMLHCKWYLDRDYVPDWKNKKEHKYFVCYDRVEGCFKYGLEHLFDSGSIIFSSEEAARKCVYWLNRHWKEDGNGI